MSDSDTPCGLFGKVPQQADFVNRHLPEGFTEYWHHWLQSGLSVSTEQLGDAWLETYLTSPVWRFALSAGVCSQNAVVGVLIPSVDEVGRYFPLTVAHASAHRPWEAYLSGEAWFDAAERVALSALDEQIGYMRLIEDLEELPAPSFEPLPRFRTVPASSGSGAAWTIPNAGDDRERMLPGLLERAYTRQLGAHSLWWTAGSEQVDPCALICAGLPEAGQMVAMLDGDWSRWGWGSEERVTESGEGATA